MKSGETVRAGQTVALLDEAAMRARLSHINRSIDVASVLRACLLQVPQDQNLDTETAKRSADLTQLLEQENDLDRELELLVRAAEADCAASHRQNRDDQIRMEHAVEALEKRLALLTQKLSMVLGVQAAEKRKSVDPFLRAHASVSVALERNDTEQKLNRIAAELNAMRAKQDRASLDRVAFLSKDVAHKLTQKAVLETYLDNPRLTVPEAGRISRVRPIPAGTQFETDETIIEVHGDQAAQYVASLRVPLKQVDQLPVGTQVAVSLAGFRQDGPQLFGRIQDWTEGDSGTGADVATAQIVLSQDSQNLLSDPRHGIALRGTSTASVIQAKLMQNSLQSALKQAVLARTDWVEQLMH